MKNIIAYCNEGIGNRLKCLISAMRVAEKLQSELILCWPKDEKVNCRFSDLFENNLVEIDLKEYQTIKNSYDLNTKYQIINTWRLIPQPEDEIPNNFSLAPFSKTGNNIDLEYGRISQLVRDHFLVYVNRLIPTQYIKDEAERFSRNLTDDTISFSIRTWIECKRSRIFDQQAVFKIMDRIINLSFYVSCDSTDFFNLLIKKYGKRVLYYPKRSFAGNRSSIEGMQDILIDLLLISRGSHLYAAYLSTFPEVAWWFGGCKAKVEIISPKTYIFLYTSEGYCLFKKWHWKKTI